jgi:hypothetical protein
LTRATIGLLAIAAIAGTAAPVTVAASDPIPRCAPLPARIAFAPPLDRPLRLEVETHRPASEGASHGFTIRYALRFSAAPRGYTLTMTMVSVDGDTGQRSARAATQLLAPLVGKQVIYRVGADDGQLILQNGDAVWAAVGADLVTRAAKAPVEEARAVGQALQSLPAAQRDALLSADLRHILRFAGQAWAPDFAEAADAAERACDTALLVSRPDPGEAAPSPVMRAETSSRVNLISGLVEDQVEEKWLPPAGGGASRLAATTRRRLTEQR